MTAQLTNPIGAHVPVAGGLATGGLRYAAQIGAEAIQVFVSNPRGWALAAGKEAEDHKLREHAERTGMPVFVHSPYLINVGSPNPQTVASSVASIRHSLVRGAAIGARGVVVHTGSAVSQAREAAVRQLREHLLPLLDEIPADGPDLLFEPMAGQGAMLCATVQDLGPYLDTVDRHPRAGVCLDTCHAFAAGHDLAAPGGVAATLDVLALTAGADRLKLIHANDSKDGCGSAKDRHENIGKGRIGAEPFAELFRHPVSRGVPLVIETPGRSAEPHRADVETLKALRDR
ncbi:deoxyribonuclease IV [Actinoallomurus iriomotensis]|uniref:Probable endonuclease 4 n=1 Tax=Actinoallomurus iriomotensis TaxID=478107 RepID=A0A9W6RZT8_9ACTN|nr:deoxyribonuclease IV [Actinoallomurus iriomotensis]GLY82855.1 putative endonuclease 4 [Actinoallomurus iriomotensis]